MISRRESAIRPFASRGRRAVIGILATIALVSALTVVLSIRATSGAQHRAAVVEIAGRQRTLTERYVEDLLLARKGIQADPGTTAKLLRESADTLLSGGEAPAVEGDDDETVLPPATDPLVREQLKQERRLVHDLTNSGAAYLANKSVFTVPLTANEDPDRTGSFGRIRILAALTSNVSLNAARTIATQADANINGLIRTQVVLGSLGLLVSVLLAIALIAATRRQIVHFRSLVKASTDLVIVFGDGGCRYVSSSVIELLGRTEQELLGEGFDEIVHPDDRQAVRDIAEGNELRGAIFRLLDRHGEWRQIEAHVTDLRADRNIRGLVLNARDISEQIRLEGELTRQAFYDGVTGLPNRALFRDRLAQALARARRTRESLAVLLLDLDGFKQINDSLGHDAGDRLLRDVAERFGEVSRPTDTLARLGGDEFTLLVEGAGDQEAATVAKRMLDSLRKPFKVGDQERQIRASIGIVLTVAGVSGAEDMMRDADVAMYAAKEAGRNRYEIYRAEMSDELDERLGLEQDLRQALSRGELSVHYQPEVNLETEGIVGVEALLRWNSPTRGPVSPGVFIPLAEQTSLIFELGAFVLGEACAQAATWRDQGLLPDGFAVWVNVSGRQLAHGGVERVVRDALAQSGLQPDQLGLEVTETAIVQESPGDHARRELAALHELGVRIAIDDFGTGFSALGQLRNFPIDMLKIDRSFVQGVETDAKDAAIVANVIGLAHSLGVPAIAEGIESEGQCDSLRGIGCDLAQGFLFARPAPPEEVAELLDRGRPRALATP
jgi:diguanylate cyclase (GGDEF)-like protein/PAS domain S-box-containing protein